MNTTTVTKDQFEAVYKVATFAVLDKMTGKKMLEEHPDIFLEATFMAAAPLTVMRKELLKALFNVVEE